jgi:hypothetical protein
LIFNRPNGSNIGIALIHYPVYDKNRNVVTTALTNLDLHDIARAAKTYGVHRYYLVTPLEDQQDIAIRILQHWQEGHGASYNTKRKQALDLVNIVDRVEDAVSDMKKEYGRPVITVATGAKEISGNISYRDMSKLLEDKSQPYLLLLGTGWGLADQVLSCADYVLEPIRGSGSYNHLSVRSAASIIVDRLLGQY